MKLTIEPSTKESVKTYPNGEVVITMKKADLEAWTGMIIKTINEKHHKQPPNSLR
jgi:hypothetical protein